MSYDPGNPGGFPPPPPPGGAYGAPMPPGGAPPNNHLVMAIVTTILCCLPLGIVSIVYATQVNSKWSVGDYQGAYAASESAKKWWLASLITGVVLAVLYILLVVVLGVFSLSTSTTSY
ncbi:CD225/dispanin family protein [Microbispora sp. H11081]|uniref:CD225/dispanin family protein n=1 Tax=Microbispora sp. H11081 TaxID=2729107 RepID=UPI001473C6D4|nr:CD225/dispanin family protein [Microbispora sp. H11081]